MYGGEVSWRAPSGNQAIPILVTQIGLARTSPKANNSKPVFSERDFSSRSSVNRRTCLLRIALTWC
jgi:hypothetical protein